MNALKHSLLAAASATLMMTGAATAAPLSNGGPNLLVNGGFETGSFAPWVSGGSGFNSVGGTANSGTFAGSFGCVGSGCVVVGPTGVSGPGSITQALTLQPGIYQLQYFVTNPAGTNLFAASVGNNTLTNSALGTIPYTRFSYVTAASGGSTNVAIGIQQDPSFMHLDDVALIQVDDGAGNNLGAASQTVATQGSRDVMDNLFDHLGNSNAGMTYLNGVGNYRAFFGIYGDSAHWDGGNTRGHRMGFMIGEEWAPNNDWNFGLVFAHAKTHFGTDTLYTDNFAHADENMGGIYANWSPDCWPGYVSGMVGYGISANAFMRENFLGAVGAHVATKQVFGGIEAGYDWQAIPQVILTPFVRFDGALLSQDSYWEYSYLSGALVPAWVDSKSPTVGRMVLGLRGATDFQGIGDVPWHLTAKLGWQDEFNRRRSVTFSEMTGPVSFSGTAFGAEPAASSLVTGVGLEAPIGTAWKIGLNYNGNFGSGQIIHEGMLGIRFTF